MTELIVILGFVGLVMYFVITIIYIILNRKKFADNLPVQLKAYRWVYASTLSFAIGSWFALIVNHWAHLSDSNLLIVWVGMVAMWFIIWYIAAIYTITEWFIPLSKRPQLPLHIIPKDKKRLIVLIIFFILVAAFMFGPF